MKTLKTIGFIFITFLLLSACKGLKVKDIIDNDSTTTLLVSHYKVECDSKYKRDLCLQIKKKGSSSAWEKYAGDIKSFTYNWGYDYKIEVTSKDIRPKPTDAPSIEYTLKKKISEVKTPDTSLFVLTVSRIKTENAIKKSVSDSTIYRIYNEVDIKCDPATECTSIEENITADNAIKFILSHDSSINNRLNISSIACTSGRNSFKEDCKD